MTDRAAQLCMTADEFKQARRDEYQHRMVIVTPEKYYDAELVCRYCGLDCACVDPDEAPPPPPTDLAVRREWRRSILTLGGQRNGTHEEGHRR